MYFANCPDPFFCHIAYGHLMWGRVGTPLLVLVQKVLPPRFSLRFLLLLDVAGAMTALAGVHRAEAPQAADSKHEKPLEFGRHP